VVLLHVAVLSALAQSFHLNYLLLIFLRRELLPFLSFTVLSPETADFGQSRVVLAIFVLIQGESEEVGSQCVW